MKKRKIRDAFVGMIASVAAGGCGNGVVDFNPSGLPAENPQTGLRPSIVFENDVKLPVAQRGEVDGIKPGVYEFSISPAYWGQPTALYIRPKNDAEGRTAPFDTSVEYLVRSDGNLTGRVVITDNDNQNFLDGEEWLIEVTGATFSSCGCSDDLEKIQVSYMRGSSGVYNVGGGQPQQPGGSSGYGTIEAKFVHPDGTPFGIDEKLTQPDFKIRIYVSPQALVAYGAPTGFQMNELSPVGKQNTCLNIASYSQPVAIVGMPGVYEVSGTMVKEPGCPSPSEVILGRASFNSLEDTVNASVVVDIR